MLKIAQTRSQICFYWFVHLCFDTFIEATKPRELGHRKLGGKKACFSDRPNTEHDKSAHNYLQKKSESDEVNLSVNLHQYTLDDWDTQSNMSGSSSIWMWWRLQELSIHLSPTPELVPGKNPMSPIEYWTPHFYDATGVVLSSTKLWFMVFDIRWKGWYPMNIPWISQ